MTASPRLIDRRAFVTDLGRGAFAVTILGIAACAPASSSAGASAPETPGGASSTPGNGSSARGSASASASASTGGALTWSHVNLGFVSAYLLVRGGEAALVDTGVENSADAIEAALGSLSLDWAAVGHVILTHKHGDHAGSAGVVLERAPDAMGYAGAEDIAGITVPRALTPVQDGDRVFDLQIVATPGHTAGSISVLDRAGSVLVAGDALRVTGGRPAYPDGQFTEDMEGARASVAKLAGLAFDTLLVGRGDPIEGGAAAAVAALAAGG
jgi:glyoxylase-like metal-dependent hydrolase (beta-lactamase superfamily II)